MLFFKPWLKTPCTLKSHVTWVESLNSWQFKDRYKSDNRWYLNVTKRGIYQSHPYIDNIRDMFEGKDRAMRERTRLDEEFKQSIEIDSIQTTADKDTKGIDGNSDEEDEQSGFINNSDIQYLPYSSLRKRKIKDLFSNF